MPITEQQRIERRKFLGSSDAAAVLGLDRYRSPADVFYDKTGQIIASGTPHNDDAVEVGNFCERAVIDWFAKKRKLKILVNDGTVDTRRIHANGIMAANFDALVDGDPTQAIEAKTTGVVSRYIDEEWGETETDQVPERIALQCQHQMAVLPELRVIWVPVLMGGVGLRHYRIERNEDLIKDLTAAEEYFWHNHVAKMIPPAELPSLETLKKIRREPNKTVWIDDALVEAYNTAAAANKVTEAAKEEAQKALINALGDAESGEYSNGLVNYFLQERKEYMVPAGSYRKLTFKKAKVKK